MKFKDLQWHLPSIHGFYEIKICDIDKGYRTSKGYWNGSGFNLYEDELNSCEFVKCYKICGVYRNHNIVDNDNSNLKTMKIN